MCCPMCGCECSPTDGLCCGCLGTGLALPDHRCNGAVRPHRERRHIWYRGAFIDDGEMQCDLVGCHARPEDVILDERGFDTGFVSFPLGGRVFGTRDFEARCKAARQAEAVSETEGQRWP